jgi:polysaccharide biosynthesis transport protein
VACVHRCVAIYIWVYFSDNLMLGKVADETLLLACPGLLESPVAKTVKTILEQARSLILGMVVNGVTVESSSGYYQSSTTWRK